MGTAATTPTKEPAWKPCIMQPARCCWDTYLCVSHGLRISNYDVRFLPTTQRRNEETLGTSRLGLWGMCSNMLESLADGVGCLCSQGKGGRLVESLEFDQAMYVYLQVARTDQYNFGVLRG
eukprot:227833-Chlamydomonas_euryale.AAC.1